MKVCPKCSADKPIDAFSMNAKRKDGRACYCRECVNRYGRSWYIKNRGRRLETCRAYAASPAGRAKQRRYREKYPDRYTAAIARWQAANPEKVAEAQRRYRAKNGAANMRRYRERHPDRIKIQAAKWRADNRERHREMGRQWAKNNPHKARAKTARYFVLKVKAIPVWSDNERIQDIYAAREFAENFFGISIDVDHIVPIRSPIVCGLHWHGNLQLLTRAQNQLKSNRHWPDMP